MSDDLEQRIRAKQFEMMLMIEDLKDLVADGQRVRALLLMGKINKLEKQIDRMIKEHENE